MMDEALILFSLHNLSTVVLCFRAMAESVSPFFTLWYLAPAEDDVRELFPEPVVLEATGGVVCPTGVNKPL